MMAEAATDWIEWTGGECPVDVDATVEIKRRDSSTSLGRSGLWYHTRDCFNSWKHSAGNYDIIAYRVVSA